jgi:hypothetical protein
MSVSVGGRAFSFGTLSQKKKKIKYFLSAHLKQIWFLFLSC